MIRDVSTTLGTRVVKENEVFSRIIRTPFGVLLPFVPTKQKSLHYLSFRQTVAQKEGYLASTNLEKPLALNLNYIKLQTLNCSIYHNYRHLEGGTTERSTVYDDM